MNYLKYQVASHDTSMMSYVSDCASFSFEKLLFMRMWRTDTIINCSYQVFHTLNSNQIKYLLFEN